MTIDIAEELKGLSPEQQEQRKKDWLDLLEAEFDLLGPELAGELVSTKVSPETLLAGLTPEKLATLTPEQRKKVRERLSQLAKQLEQDDQKPE